MKLPFPESDIDPEMLAAFDRSMRVMQRQAAVLGAAVDEMVRRMTPSAELLKQLQLMAKTTQQSIEQFATIHVEMPELPHFQRVDLCRLESTSMRRRELRRPARSRRLIGFERGPSAPTSPRRRGRPWFE